MQHILCITLVTGVLSGKHTPADAEEIIVMMQKAKEREAMPIYKNIEAMVGNTPLVALSGYCATQALEAIILAKLESHNPAGSIKDRVALSMIQAARQEGLLNKDTLIIEPTSGNTGIGLAALAALYKYRLILTMPETMSLERQKLLRAYGAELVLTSGDQGMKGAIEKAKELAQGFSESFVPGQFTNPANSAVHRTSTGPEIWAATQGDLDVFACTVGTGGTITGVGEYLKSKNPRIRVVAVEPAGSPVLSGGRAGAHKIQGIGAGFVPAILNTQIYDEVITVKDEDAFTTAQKVARSDGVLVGVSSGAALWAATQLAQRQEYQGKRIVLVFPDSGERYISTTLFA